MSETESLAATDSPQNPGRRRLLTWTTGVVGAAGVGFAAWPFVSSLQPSARARVVGAPVEVNVAEIEPGQLTRVQWRGQTIGVMRRTARMIEDLEDASERLRDPESSSDQQPAYVRNFHRSIKPEVFVANIHCTHLGCVPQVLPEVGAQPFDSNWRGGFFCPCHRSTFDLAGRVFRGVPAVLNLLIPPHRFIDDDRILIGENPEGVA